MTRKGKRVQVISLAVFFLLVSGYIIWQFFIVDNVTISATRKTYPHGVYGVTCSLQNNTLGMVYFGNPFYVERLVDGEWVPVNESGRDHPFELPLHNAPPLMSTEIFYRVELYSTFDEDGDYRIVLEVMEGQGKYEDFYTIYCPFSVRG